MVTVTKRKLAYMLFEESRDIGECFQQQNPDSDFVLYGYECSEQMDKYLMIAFEEDIIVFRSDHW